jgi:transposase-like protein
MKHEYKTKEYKEQILNDYFESKMSIVEFCKDKDINSSTFGRWVSYDERFIDRRRSRLKCHSKKYTYEQKLRACELHEEGISYLSIAKTIGCSKTSVIGWYNTYKKKGEYYLMDKNDIINNSDDEFVKIKMQNEELKQKNRKLQLENDVYEEALRVLKNYPALSLKASLKDLTNSVKTEIINNLRAKYSDRYMLKDLLEFLDLKERTYHDNRTALNRKPKYEDYDKKVLEFILGDEKLNGKQGYRTIMSIMKTSDDWGEEKIIERRIRKTMKERSINESTKVNEKT